MTLGARNVTLVDVPRNAHKGSYSVQIFLFFVVLVLLFGPAPALYFLDVLVFVLFVIFFASFNPFSFILKEPKKLLKLQPC